MHKSKRFLPRKAKNGIAPGKVSHEQVTQAILAFQKRGGLIRKLPPEPTGRRTMVGHRWGSAYETIFEQA